ncbi:polysaccharide biosynthesis/export family protein [Mangrovimonas futianensis]|uniref:polysaccharide biosynthesis/export family protein n=1 Tax=Mangrovimonas futianensis TaxID=2895523 RepID=UPI001E36222E|nr:polysaccharide biosynthesis/export family protein [Mangrovimonas futianensis]MCF1420235.1 polysaccharide biosynthesis/export family protein [Mangrovimonas futianensis]
MRNILRIYLPIIFLVTSCATKKEIWYLQDSEQYNNTNYQYESPKIQPNDILKIDVAALVEETAKPYNKPATGQQNTNMGGGSSGSNAMMLMQGYLVSPENTINLPILGEISTEGKTVRDLQRDLIGILEGDGHLVNPTVMIRLLNARFTILGEVGSPGTYNFSEDNITIFQAIGMAGDLQINGKRNDIMFIRERDGQRQIATIDIRSGEVFNSPYYQIKPNDLIIVNPNSPRVKQAGYLKDITGTVGFLTLIISTVLLISNL